MDLIEIYKSILNVGGMKADESGLVSVSLNRDSAPVLIEGKRLALPTPNNLSDAAVSNKIIFHPLRESILRGESEVAKRLRKTINIRLNYTFGAIAQNLLNIAASVENHRLLSPPDQTEILNILTEADETTVNNFVKVMIAAVNEDPERAFVNIYMKKGGLVGTHKFSRAGIATFPMYEELKKGSEVIFGVKLRKKDINSYISLCEYMLPNLQVLGTFNVGSDSQLAPIMESLMKTVMGIASRFNDILELYSKFIDASDDLRFDDKWTDAFINLDELAPEIRQIPMQLGNEGKQDSVASSQQQTAQPVPLQMPHIPLPTYQQQPQHPFQQQPQFNMQPQVQAPALKHTSKGLDWNSLPQVGGFNQYGNQVPQYNQPTRLGQPANSYGSSQPVNAYGNQFGNNRV
jgi:hypothetical protein